MISRISTFLKLSKSIIKVLKPNETKSMVFNMILSVFNTFLELFSITTIVYLLLVISGQNLTESKISYLFNSILPEESLIISSAILMISVVIVKTVFQIIFTYYQEKISQQVQNRINNTLFIKFINSKYEKYINDS